MANPTLYIANAILDAEQGLGDGTAYASGTSATVDQANKRFTIGGLSLIADLGDDTDDLLNGMLLYFPASGNRYHVTDWTAGTDQATVAETPATVDTGACRFLRTLYTYTALASHPAKQACDGVLAKLFKVQAANVALDLRVFLPNLLGQGGFEELAVGPISNTYSAPGVWYRLGAGVDVVSSSALRGSRMGLWDGATDNYFAQRTLYSLTKGHRYRILLLAQAVGGNTSTGALQVQVTTINGTSIVVQALAAITTTATWYIVDFVSGFDCAATFILALTAANIGSATDVRVDEFYIWDITDAPSALLAFGHNWDGITSVNVIGCRCDPSRTSFSSGTGTDDLSMITGVTVNGSGPVVQTWTVGSPPTSTQAWPVYRILIPANTAYQYQVAELLLAAKYSLGRSFRLGIDPEGRQDRDTVTVTESGAEQITIRTKPRILEGSFPHVSAADRAFWDVAFRERHFSGTKRDVVAVKWDGHLREEPVLFRCHKLRTPWQTPTVADVEMELREVL